MLNDTVVFLWLYSTTVCKSTEVYTNADTDPEINQDVAGLDFKMSLS